MNYVKLFEEFIYEENLKDKNAKRVGWVMLSNDIHKTSGNVNSREKKYNIAAKGNLYLNYSTSDDYDSDEITVPNDIPILWYGAGPADEKSNLFIKNKKLDRKNLYNQQKFLPLSGNKVMFAEAFGKFDWLPNTIFSKEEAEKGAVGFPVIAKIKDGHSGLGIEKFDTAAELKNTNDKFDLFCQFVDFKREYRVMFCQDKIILINERVPMIDNESSIRTKKAKDKINFIYVYQDLNKIKKEFIQEMYRICGDIKTVLDLNLWSIDVVVDQQGKVWVMETSSATGLGSVKMCEVYKAVYEDFYKKLLPDKFLENLYLNYVVPGHQNYFPKYKKEIESSNCAMDYTILTNAKTKNGYRYFFNLDKKP